MTSFGKPLGADLRTAWSEHRPYVGAAAAIFALGALLGVVLHLGGYDLWAALHIESPRELYPGEITLLTLLLNNTVALGVMVVGALTLGLVTVAGLGFNGVLLGYLAVPIVRTQGLDFLAVGILPHGVLELPAYFVAGGIGLRLVVCGVFRVAGRRDRVVDRGGLRRAAVLFAAAWVVLAVAAVVELYVTATVLEVLYG